MNCDGPKPKSVDAYIAQAPEYARPICAAVRRLVSESAPGLREAIKWGAPAWVGRKLVCGVAAFKHHVTFWCFRGEELSRRDPSLAAVADQGPMHGFKFTAVDQVPTATLRKLVKAAVALDADEAVKPAPRKRRAELPMPADFAKAIKSSAKAAAFFESIPPSAKRDLIEWVVEAKRAETRAKRLAESVKMLAGGHRRNEQYRR